MELLICELPQLPACAFLHTSFLFTPRCYFPLLSERTPSSRVRAEPPDSASDFLLPLQPSLFIMHPPCHFSPPVLLLPISWLVPSSQLNSGRVLCPTVSIPPHTYSVFWPASSLVWSPRSLGTSPRLSKRRCSRLHLLSPFCSMTRPRASVVWKSPPPPPPGFPMPLFGSSASCSHLSAPPLIADTPF